MRVSCGSFLKLGPPDNFFTITPLSIDNPDTYYTTHDPYSSEKRLFFLKEENNSCITTVEAVQQLGIDFDRLTSVIYKSFYLEQDEFA